jgi:hypothetical protein
MDVKPDNAPPGWLEILEESEAELAGGLLVSSEDVHRELQESIARLEAKAANRHRGATLRRRGRAWVQAGRYWVAYSTQKPPVIVAVFYDMANIPGRL